MSFGQNLQFLRKMHNRMTQEELAERLNVSRQTISKWELDAAFPEVPKIIELCQLFSCTMDQLLRENMIITDDAYSDIRLITVPYMRYTYYTVISPDPETDAIEHIRRVSSFFGCHEPEIIGWDFPHVSQEQINVYHLHGYTAAWILATDFSPCDEMPVVTQDPQRYAVITIREPQTAPFYLIPNAYKVLMSYIQVNGLTWDHSSALECFEKEYEKDGVQYMDVYLAVD